MLTWKISISAAQKVAKPPSNQKCCWTYYLPIKANIDSLDVPDEV